MPVMVPERYAMRSAPEKLWRLSAATRTLPSTAMRMPIWPTVSEKPAPITNAIARANATSSVTRPASSMPSFAKCSIASVVGGTMYTDRNSATVNTAINGTMPRTCRFR